MIRSIGAQNFNAQNKVQKASSQGVGPNQPGNGLNLQNKATSGVQESNPFQVQGALKASSTRDPGAENASNIIPGIIQQLQQQLFKNAPNSQTQNPAQVNGLKLNVSV